MKCFDLLEVTDRNDFIIDKMLPIIKDPEIYAAAEKYPSLLYLMAWAAYTEVRVDDMVSYIDRYYAGYSEIVARDPDHAYNIYYMRIFDFRVPFSQLLKEAASPSHAPEVKGVQGSITMNMPFLHRSICDFSKIAAKDPEANIVQMSGVIGWLFGEEWDLLAESLTAG